MPSEENGRTVLIISDPVEIETVNMNGSHEGLRMMPWLRSMPNENIVIIPMDRVITVVELQPDSEVVRYYQKFIFTNLQQRLFREDKSHKEDGICNFSRDRQERI